MRQINRKSTPSVASGKVQKKNDWDLTPSYYSHRQRDVIIDRKRPGQGYRHLLYQKDIRTFIDILPDWAELSAGLNAIVLAPGRWDLDGYHSRGVVHVCAWHDELWRECDVEFYEEHKDLFARLGIPCKISEDGTEWLCKFTESTVRAYQLLHILLHELGHHHDRITTKSQRRASRGESYAEQYAIAHEALIWNEYSNTFGIH